jgi:type I restriction enzyme S subunit
VKLVSLSEVASVRSGYAFKSKDWVDSGIPVVKIANIKDGFLTLDGCSFVNEAVARQASSFELEPGDILISMTGYIGEVARVRDEGRMLLNQRVGRFLVTDRSRLDGDYLFHCLRDPSLKARFAAHAHGAAQPNISAATIEQQAIPLPSLAVQRRIAGILSAYDDLIENCQRRIQILEQMARALYREWFVKFRYPGHESVPLVPSPLGEIPQGWQIRRLGDLVSLGSGFAFKSQTFVPDGEHSIVTIKNVQDGSFDSQAATRVAEIPANVPSHCMLSDGNILLSLTGNVGRVCLVFGGRYLLNQRVARLLPLEEFDWAFTYALFRQPELRVRLEQLSSGVAQQNLSPIAAANIEIACAPDSVRKQYAEIAEPLYRQVVHLSNLRMTARRIRDALLPRLVSGQIDLDAA